MAKEEETPNKKSIFTNTDEQAIESLIQMRKHQLGALNKIMSAIKQPVEKIPSGKSEKHTR